jgi:membrane protease YdiL (CAAX protease family)
LFAAFWGTVVITWIAAIVGAAHVALQFAAGQRAAEPRPAYPALLGDRGRRFRGWVPGAVIGAFAGVASTLLFWRLGVELGDAPRMAQKLMPGLEHASRLLVGTALLPAFVGVAVAEEILFRGVIQGWIARLLGGGRAAAVVAVLAASLLWALGHAGTVEPLWLKLVQIFVLGLVFGWLALRYSVESAILAHAGLNVTALLLGYALGMDG